jgi:hypothetical protein
MDCAQPQYNKLRLPEPALRSLAATAAAAAAAPLPSSAYKNAQSHAN